MTRLYLMTYDMVSPRRLRRMHRLFSRFGVPIQYSVFLGRLSEARVEELAALIVRIINPREDDVRLYPLPERGWERRLGKPVLAEGLTLTFLPESMRPPLSPRQPEDRPPMPPSSAPSEIAKAPAHAKLSRVQARRAREQMARQQTGQRRGLQVIS